MSVAMIRPLLSGGAFITIAGVDRWYPSRRAALDELEARKPHGTIDYPLGADTEGRKNAEARA